MAKAQGRERLPNSGGPPAGLLGEALRNSGRPLEQGTRARMEGHFGIDFDDVRIHTGPGADESARLLKARAFAAGRDVVFAAGRYAPGTGEGDRLLAHELAHVVQQGRSTSSDVVVRRDSPPGAGEFRLPFYSGADPLSRYTVLKEADPDGWEALAVTARMRTLGTVGEEPPEPTIDVTEIAVPARSLIRPKIPEAGGEDFRTQLWPIVSEAPSGLELATDVIREEILRRWAATNEDLLDSGVQIRLLDPLDVPLAPVNLESVAAGGPSESQLATGGQKVLEFELEGQVLETEDGSLDPLTVDLLGSNDLETTTAEVGDEALVVGIAGDLLVSTTDLLDGEEGFWNEVENVPHPCALSNAREHLGLLGPSVSAEGQAQRRALGLELGLFLADHPEFEGELRDVNARMNALSQKAWETVEVLEERFRFGPVEEEFAEDMPRGIEAAERRGSAAYGEGSYFVGTMEYAGAGLGHAWWSTANLLTGGYYETRGEALGAYCGGKISWAEVEKISDAAAARGAVVGLVTVALTAASVGLAGPGAAALGRVVPALGTVGRTVLFEGAAGGVSNVLGMTTSTAATSTMEFANPAAQALWERGTYSPGQIAAGGLVGFGMGAGTAAGGIALGKLATWFRNFRARPTGRLPAPGAGVTGSVETPPGWVSEEVSPGVVRYTHPDVPGEVVATESGIQYQGATGEAEVPLQGQGPTVVPEELPAAPTPSVESAGPGQASPPVAGGPGAPELAAPGSEAVPGAPAGGSPLPRTASSTRRTTRFYRPKSPTVEYVRGRTPAESLLPDQPTAGGMAQASRAREAATAAGSDIPSKTTAVGQRELRPGVIARQRRVSGWTEIPERRVAVDPEVVRAHAEEIGHTLRPAGGADQLDQGGFPGKYSASHAEKQQILARPNEPVGVSREMCPDCIRFFKREAAFRGQRQIVSDPQATRVFEPDGSITEYWRDGSVVRLEAAGGARARPGVR